MRISNIQFGKGSIIFANFPTDSADAFLNNRPLVVVSHPVPIFNQVIVCGTGTKMKPGIQIRLWNYHMNRPLGNSEVSTIYPYSLYTIKTENIDRQIGQLDRFTMKEVDKAVQFFLGFSDEIPKFMEGQPDLFDVTVTYSNPFYTFDQRLGSEYSQNIHREIKIFQPVFPEEAPQKAAAPEEPRPQVIKKESPGTVVDPTKKPSPVSVVTPGHGASTSQSIRYPNDPYISAFIEKYCRLVNGTKSSSRDIYTGYCAVREKEGWPEIVSMGFGKSLSSYIARRYGNAIRTTKPSSGPRVYFGIQVDMPTIESVIEEPVTEPAIKEWKDNKIILTVNLNTQYPKDPQELTKLFDMKSLCMIISRYAPIGAIASKYNITTATAEKLRKDLTAIAITNAASALRYLEAKPEALNKYDSFFKLGVLLCIQFNGGSNSGKVTIRLNQATMPIRSEYRINFSDEKWNDMRK